MVDPLPLSLGEAVGVGVDVDAGAVDDAGVGVGVAEVGAGEAGTEAEGLAFAPAGVVGQPPCARPPLPVEVRPVATPCGARVSEADGIGVLRPPSAEPLVTAVGATGGRDRHGAGATAMPVPVAELDGTEAGRVPDPVLADAPLTAPVPWFRPPVGPGPVPKLGVSAWAPWVSTVEPTSTNAARSGGTAAVTAVTAAAAARPASRRIHRRPRSRVTDCDAGEAAPAMSQPRIPGRQARAHHAAARRSMAVARAASRAERHSPDRQ